MPGVGNDRDTVQFVVGKLLTVGRARDAATLAAYRGAGLSSEIVVRILTDAAREQLREGTGSNDHSMFLFSVEELLQRLDKAHDVSEDRVASLEYTYLAMLEHSRRPPVVLHKTLSTSPEFFVKVLRSVYRPASDSGVEEAVEDTKRARSLAGHAYGLLRSGIRFLARRAALSTQSRFRNGSIMCAPCAWRQEGATSEINISGTFWRHPQQTPMASGPQKRFGN
jgi:hypothetical protein